MQLRTRMSAVLGDIGMSKPVPRPAVVLIRFLAGKGKHGAWRYWTAIIAGPGRETTVLACTRVIGRSSIEGSQQRAGHCDEKA